TLRCAASIRSRRGRNRGRPAWSLRGVERIEGSLTVRVLGVDGRRGGWVGAEVADRTVRWHIFGDTDELASVAADYDAVGIDVPIGLPDSGPRECDVEARRLLRAR